MKKGFTLVELLAVLVILAVILVIAVPMIISSINNAKMSAIDSSVRLIISQIKFKRSLDSSYDVSAINASNTYEELGIENGIFSEIVAVVENEDTENEIVRVTVVGKDKYAGYAATGTKDEVNVYKTTLEEPLIASVDIDLSSSVISDSVITGSTITIEWEEQTGDADTYNLESKYDSNEWESVAVDLEEPSYEYSIPNNGASTVQFRVNAENVVGESDWIYTEIIDISILKLNVVITGTASIIDIHYYNGMFVGVGAGDLITSTDGITWRYRKYGTDRLNFIYNFNNVWVTGGLNGKIMTSVDALSWATKTFPGRQSYISIKEYDGKAIIMGTTGKGAISIDGNNWSSVTDSSGASCQDIDYFNGKWIAVAQNGKISTSTDGINWTSQVLGTVTYNDIYIVNNKAYVVGNSGTILVSSDGINWDSQVVGNSNLKSIYYGDGLYVVVGLNGEIYTSSDGVDWVKRETNATSSLNSVHYNNGLWISVGSSSNVLLSNDGINWQLFVLEPSVTLNKVNYYNNMWYFIGGGTNGGVVGTFSG